MAFYCSQVSEFDKCPLRVVTLAIDAKPPRKTSKTFLLSSAGSAAPLESIIISHRNVQRGEGVNLWEDRLKRPRIE